jgi:hypothetical protein
VKKSTKLALRIYRKELFDGKSALFWGIFTPTLLAACACYGWFAIPRLFALMPPMPTGVKIIVGTCLILGFMLLCRMAQWIIEKLLDRLLTD